MAFEIIKLIYLLFTYFNFTTTQWQAPPQAATVQCMQKLRTQCAHHYKYLTAELLFTVLNTCQLPKFGKYGNNLSNIHSTFHHLLIQSIT